MELATSKVQHHRNNVHAVLRVLGLPPDREHAPPGTLRALLDGVDDAELFTAGIADYWLDLGPREGSERRKAPMPRSPFFPDGTGEKASKGAIAVWDQEWLSLRAAAALAGVKTKEGLALVASLTADRIPMMIGFLAGKEQVLGHADSLPISALDLIAEPGKFRFDVRWLRLYDALQLQWRDRKEAHRWFEILKASHGHLERELGASLGRQFTGEASGGEGAPGTRL